MSSKACGETQAVLHIRAPGGSFTRAVLVTAPISSKLLRVCVCSLSYVRLFSTPWTVARWAPLSVHGLNQARILEWLPFPAPGNLPSFGNKCASSESPALQVDSLTSVPLGKPQIVASRHQNSMLFLRCLDFSALDVIY